MRETQSEYNLLFVKLEKLYLDDSYASIIELVENRKDNLLFEFGGSHYVSICEIVAVSYVEIKDFQSSLKVTKECLNYILNSSEIINDDILTFMKLRSEVLIDQKRYLKLLRELYLLEKRGIVENELVLLRNDLEENIFSSYIKMNTYFLYLVLGIILISIISLLQSNKSFLNSFTTIGLIWVVLHYLFKSQIKEYLMKTIYRFAPQRIN